jgi:cytidylate kinase
VLIAMVRDWSSTVSGGEPLPGGGAIAGRFAAFREDLPSICAKLHLRVEELTFANYAYMVPALLTEQATGPPRSSTKPVIAIDGPAAAGKGTLARRIAAVLGLPYLDTGLLYRAVGRLVLDGGGDPADPMTAETAARALRPDDLERRDLRGPVADAAAAAVAAIPGVRAALLDFQRGFATERGAVLDGRDIGTVIFPDAPAKLYVTASLAERARRRWLELKAKGIAADLVIVEAEMLARDTRDAPNMRRAVDADLLDTTSLDAEAAFTSALGTLRRKLERAKLPKPSDPAS